MVGWCAMFPLWFVIHSQQNPMASHTTKSKNVKQFSTQAGHSHVTKVSGSCSSDLDSEIIHSHSGI